MPQQYTAGSNGLGDIFLSVKGAKSGVIKGEAQDTVHGSEIDVLSWTWGLQARPNLGGGTASGKAVTHELKIVKRVDSASTPLMSALKSNEIITKAVLTQRKAGKSQLEFLKVTIENGRVTGLTIEAGAAPGVAEAGPPRRARPASRPAKWPLSQRAWSLLGLSPPDLDQILEEVEEKLWDVKGFSLEVKSQLETTPPSTE